MTIIGSRNALGADNCKRHLVVARNPGAPWYFPVLQISSSKFCVLLVTILLYAPFWLPIGNTILIICTWRKQRIFLLRATLDHSDHLYFSQFQMHCDSHRKLTWIGRIVQRWLVHLRVEPRFFESMRWMNKKRPEAHTWQAIMIAKSATGFWQNFVLPSARQHVLVTIEWTCRHSFPLPLIYLCIAPNCISEIIFYDRINNAYWRQIRSGTSLIRPQY